MSHGNDTQNSSFLDVCFALKNNVFRTLNVADVCVVREINEESLRCEYITDSNTNIVCVSLQDLDVKVGDVVLVIFTNNDFRASLNAFKAGQTSTDSKTTMLHERAYGVVIGIIYRKPEV